jgi:shikimate dehydrogenase
MIFKSAAIYGLPVAHSRSPLIHGAWLHEHKISGAYLRKEVSPAALPLLLHDFRNTGLAGANLTLPLKEAACAYVALDEIAAKLQAVNTIWLEDGKLRGTNTDVFGFASACQEQVPEWRNALEHVIVLGAGGAAKAVIYALFDAETERVTVINRTKARGENLATLFGAKVKSGDWDSLYKVLPQATMLVNATSLGMSGQPRLDLEVKRLKANAIVADIVYAPLETNLLKHARAAGYKTVDGLSMLLHQAVPAFERWFGVNPKVTQELRALVAADLKGIK